MHVIRVGRLTCSGRSLCLFRFTPTPTPTHTSLIIMRATQKSYITPSSPLSHRLAISCATLACRWCSSGVLTTVSSYSRCRPPECRHGNTSAVDPRSSIDRTVRWCDRALRTTPSRTTIPLVGIVLHVLTAPRLGQQVFPTHVSTPLTHRLRTRRRRRN